MKFCTRFLLSIGVWSGCASAFAPTTSFPALQIARSSAARSPVMLSPGERFPADMAAKLGVKGKNAVVYFYGSDGSPSCTKEADAFNKALPEFRKLNIDVVGVRSEKNAKQDFEQRYNQRLVKDPNDEMRKTLAIPADLFGTLPGRETYVIGKDGMIGLVFNNQFAAEQHVEEALKAAKGLSRKGSADQGSNAATTQVGKKSVMEIVSENSAKIVIFQIFYFSAVLAWLIATRPGWW